jgi:outer membrane protein TolC
MMRWSNAAAAMRRRTASLAALAALALPAAGAAQTPDSAARAALPVVTLEEAIRRSERVQPSVVSALNAVENTDARVRSAFGAYLPTVRANGSGGPSFSAGPSRVDPTTGQVISGDRTNTSLNMGLTASVDVFTGFRRGAESRAARASNVAAEASLLDARYQQAYITTNQFFTALSAEDLVTVREASVRRAEEQLKVSIARLQAGSATRSDSLRSTVQLGSARLQLIQAQAALAAAEAQLARLIGEPGRVRAADDSAFYAVVTLDTAAVHAEAVAQSPQVRAAEATAAAADAQASVARAAYWPTASLSASTGWNGSNSTDYDLFNNRSLSLGVSWNIFNGFQREQTVTVQDNVRVLAEAQAADARREVGASVIEQLAQLAAAREAIEISQISLEAAQEDLRVQQERYRLGASTIVDVLTSQEALTQAEVDAVTSRFDYLAAKAQLEALIGRQL